MATTFRARGRKRLRLSSERKARIEATLVLTAMGEMAPQRRAERLLHAIAERESQLLGIDLVFEFPSEQDLVLELPWV